MYCSGVSTGEQADVSLFFSTSVSYMKGSCEVHPEGGASVRDLGSGGGSGIE